jgi:argininosuccinate lyase
VTASTEVAVGAVVTAEWPEEELAEAAGDGFSTATGVADRLAQAGLPFRTAHEIVARAGETADPGIDEIEAAVEAELGKGLDEITDRAAIEATLDPAESVRMRDSRGGPAPEALVEHLDRARESLDADKSVLDERQKSLDDANATLSSEVQRYV